MIVDVPLDLVRLGLDDRPIDLAVWLNDWFEHSPVINANWPTQNPGELLIRQDAQGWDGMELYCFIDESGTQARLIARLDNLGKGASGAAIQNLNIMCGLPETTGLRL
jgi:N-acetyl-gamma-glutamyl-phosphate reductase